MSHPEPAAFDETHVDLRLLADAMPQLVWSARADGTHDYYNRRWYDYTGARANQMPSQDWNALIHPEDREQAEALWERALASGEPYEVEFRFRRADGAYRWFLGRALPIRDAEGQVTRWFGTCTEIEEQKRAEQQAQARAEREAVLHRISLAIRSSLDPDEIQGTVSRILAETLGADRCYFGVYHFAHDYSIIAADYHRPPLASIAGRRAISDYAEVMRPLEELQQALVVRDAHDAGFGPALVERLDAIDLRSFVRVPLFDEGHLIAVLAAAMAGGPRDWTPAEVQLIEEAATLTRAAVEMARVHQRERHIADTLQGALKPAIPYPLTGLDLASHYRPALDEATVGGDFFDVFPIEKQCYALVVGDLSGKGLAAAAQVATVRNMLRYAVYSSMTIAEAVTRLNHILTVNNLLTGFATLSVAAFDFGLRNLTYVSCGQEPALLRRTAAGDVQELPPTGPALGVTENARFREEVIPLGVGDAFAFYTDGLTESGPNRRDLLGVSGLAALFKDGGKTAEALKDYVIAGAERYAHGVFLDDICLLVGVVKRGDGSGMGAEEGGEPVPPPPVMRSNA